MFFIFAVKAAHEYILTKKISRYTVTTQGHVYTSRVLTACIAGIAYNNTIHGLACAIYGSRLCTIFHGLYLAQSMDWDNPRIVLCKPWIHTLHHGHNPWIVTGTVKREIFVIKNLRVINFRVKKSSSASGSDEDFLTTKFF